MYKNIWFLLHDYRVHEDTPSSERKVPTRLEHISNKLWHVVREREEEEERFAFGSKYLMTGFLH